VKQNNPSHLVSVLLVTNLRFPFLIILTGEEVGDLSTKSFKLPLLTGELSSHGKAGGQMLSMSGLLQRRRRDEGSCSNDKNSVRENG
jgi:hypothetical protein